MKKKIISGQERKAIEEYLIMAGLARFRSRSRRRAETAGKKYLLSQKIVVCSFQHQFSMGQGVKKSVYSKTVPILAVFFFMVAGCAGFDRVPSSTDRELTEILRQYPQTGEPLSIAKLSEASIAAVAALPGNADVSIIVHPAYSLFFDNVIEKNYPEAKYSLIKKQFENEANFLRDQSRSGNIVILILPADFASRDSGPLSYTTYLNRAFASKGRAFYITSQSSSVGTLAMEDMVTLYRFLQTVKAQKVLIGGGYIGRCQEEFFDQLVKYFDEAKTYIVPEISTISPEDISDHEAAGIYTSLRRQDYTPVRAFIGKKTGGSANILSIPQKREF